MHTTMYQRHMRACRQHNRYILLLKSGNRVQSHSSRILELLDLVTLYQQGKTDMVPPSNAHISLQTSAGGTRAVAQEVDHLLA